MARFGWHLAPAGVLLVLALTASGALAQGDGRISGIVRDVKSKRVLPFASISIVELRKGALSDTKGEFMITGVTPGTYTVRVQMLGYEEVQQEAVTVAAGQAVKLDFDILEIVVREEKEIVVTGERELVDVNLGTTVRSVTSRDIENLPVQNLVEVLEQQAGVSSENDQIHVRGGRTDETLWVVDNVVSRNLLTGESTAGNIRARSVAEVNVITGGFDAQYGQALSGVVDVKLKEGGDRYSGGVSVEGGTYSTRFFNGQIGGPDWFVGGLKALGVNIPGTASFIFDASADFTNTYLPDITRLSGGPTLRSGYQDSFANGYDYNYGFNVFGIKLWDWMPAQENLWRAFYKWTYRPTPNNKIGLSFRKGIGFNQGFTSRPFEDLSGFDVGFPWAWTNRLDHYGTITQDTNSQLLEWTHLTSKTSFFKVHGSRFFTAYNQAVDGKNWKQYDQPQDASLPPDQDELYFVDTGDHHRWIDTYSEVFELAGEFVSHLGNHHRLKAGMLNDWQQVQYLTIEFPWDFDPDSLGSSHDLWRVNPIQGNFYVQDQMDYEGFVANVGLRVDYWFPGNELEAAVADTSNKNISPTTRAGFLNDTNSLFGKRYKTTFSPRVQVSHPITERDNFFFNYGKFTQYAPYFFIYSKMSSVSSETFPIVGNPNLNPEISIQYEVGGRHTFREDIGGNITLFWKDIYDYPTSTTFRRLQGDELVDILIYRNQDFARSRGFEIEFEKRRRKYWRWRASYEFSVASGKSSDPNAAKLVEEQGGDAAETRLGEEFLFWNRPHRLKGQVEFRVDAGAPRPKLLGVTLPTNWGLSVFAEGVSGRAYTPIQLEGEPAAKPYSENGPFQVIFNLRFNKAFRVGRNQRLNLTLTGNNILNTLVPRRIDPFTGSGYEAGRGLFSPEELGKLSSDQARAFRLTSQLANPSAYLPGSEWRAGFEYDF
jgi:outer membrane receptor protein involved in Fe transport